MNNKQKIFLGLMISITLISICIHYFWKNIYFDLIASFFSILMWGAFLTKSIELTASHLNDRSSSILHAMFGSLTELIISIYLVKEGLYDIVKASITGSVIGKLLLGVGLVYLLEGKKNKSIKMKSLFIESVSSILTVALISYSIPTLFLQKFLQIFYSPSLFNSVSVIFANLLIVILFEWLYFSMKTHKNEFIEINSSKSTNEELILGKQSSIFLLALSTIFVGFQSELISNNLKNLIHTNPFFSEIFIGAIFIGTISIFSDFLSELVFDSNNSIERQIYISIEGCLQVVLLNVPILIMVSYFFGNMPMNIVLNKFEVISIAISCFILKEVIIDNYFTWYKGVLLITVYIILGVCYWFV